MYAYRYAVSIFVIDPLFQELLWYRYFDAGGSSGIRIQAEKLDEFNGLFFIL